MRINQNSMAINANRNLSTNNVMLGKSLEKLSSGFRINRAADDAAGLVISQGLRSQVSGLRQATRNAQDGISVVQTAEGALNEVHNLLGRMRDLAVQKANTGSVDATAAGAIDAELGELITQIGDIGTQTKFGGSDVFTATAKTFQVGANSGDTLSVTVGTITGVPATAAAATITAIDTAISNVSTQRGTLGASQNRLESVINNLNVTTENLVASESRIRDTDMASEMTNFTKSQILSQAATAMLSQANQVPQGVLSLLR
jgi:flagellin